MIDNVSAEEFLRLADKYTILDVRSPGEFESGHIPGAISMPLFSNDERAKIGTLYKQKGKDIAVLKGLDFVGPKMSRFVKTAKKNSVDNTVLLHCWRGGMRSGSVAWLLSTAGLNVKLLEGGYKNYRSFIHDCLSLYSNMIVLGGKTGSGKTFVLDQLQELGANVVQLEYLASHKGSAFGAMGQNIQPSTEQFENDLYADICKFKTTDLIWIEDESRSVGKVFLPEGFFNNMRVAPLFFIDVSKKDRLDLLINDYTDFDKSILIENINKIAKRLGPQNAKEAVMCIENDNYSRAIDLVLDYYDKAYLYGVSKRSPESITMINIEEGTSLKDIAIKLIDIQNKFSYGK